VRLARIVIVGIICVAVSGCIGGAVAGQTSVVSPSPTPTDDPVINSVSFTSLSIAQACALLTQAEAGQILGRPLVHGPQGVSDKGDRVECLYQDAATATVGTFIRIATNRLGFDGMAAQVNLHRDAHTLVVNGFQAIGADFETDPINEEAVLCVKIAHTGQDPALWVEAPTSVAAKAAAELILPRLAALH
jgi:hypothetical protein